MPGTRLLAMHGARDLRPTAGEAAALDGSGGGPNGTAGDSSAVAMDLPGSGGGPNGTAGDSSAAAEAPPGSDGSGGGSSPAAVVQAGDGGGGGSKTAAAGGPLPCEASGYCSLDSSKVWHGDIATNEKLKEMLESVSYKKEASAAVAAEAGAAAGCALGMLHKYISLGSGAWYRWWCCFCLLLPRCAARCGDGRPHGPDLCRTPCGSGAATLSPAPQPLPSHPRPHPQLIFTIGSMDQSGAYIMAAMNLVKGARDLGEAAL